jgi:molybdopterin/thiamine biosynthesis adenylyltransferase
MNQSKNLGIMSKEELLLISKKNVLIIGVGGLGGYVASSLARLGVKEITIVDFDKFDESNINRQLYANTKTLGKSKVEITKQQLIDINPDINITIIDKRYDENIDLSKFDSIDIVFDAVDNIPTKVLIENHCAKLDIPLIHGAIAGWYGQVGIILPNTNILNKIYQHNKSGAEKELKSPTFIPAIIGNLMVSEFIKFYLHKLPLINKLLFIDVLEHEYRIIYNHS